MKKSSNHGWTKSLMVTALLTQSALSYAICDYQTMVKAMEGEALATTIHHTKRMADSKDINSDIGFIGHSGFVSPETAEKQANEAMKAAGARMDDYKAIAGLMEESANLQTILNLAIQEDANAQETDYVGMVPQLFSLTSDINAKRSAHGKKNLSMNEVASSLLNGAKHDVFCPNGDYFTLEQVIHSIAGVSAQLPVISECPSQSVKLESAPIELERNVDEATYALNQVKLKSKNENKKKGNGGLFSRFLKHDHKKKEDKYSLLDDAGDSSED